MSSGLLSLFNELLEGVIRQLDNEDIRSLGATCRTLYHICLRSRPKTIYIRGQDWIVAKRLKALTEPFFPEDTAMLTRRPKLSSKRTNLTEKYLAKITSAVIIVDEGRPESLYWDVAMNIPRPYTMSHEEKSSCGDRILKAFSLLRSRACPKFQALSLDFRGLDQCQIDHLDTYAVSWLDLADGRRLTRFNISSLRYRGPDSCQFYHILLKACHKTLKIADISDNKRGSADHRVVEITGPQLEKLHFRYEAGYGSNTMRMWPDLLDNIDVKFPKLVSLSLDGNTNNILGRQRNDLAFETVAYQAERLKKLRYLKQLSVTFDYGCSTTFIITPKHNHIDDDFFEGLAKMYMNALPGLENVVIRSEWPTIHEAYWSKGEPRVLCCETKTFEKKVGKLAIGN